MVETPPTGLGTINDMWFRGSSTSVSPVPTAAKAARYLILPPGYDGPLPDSGYFVRDRRRRGPYARAGLP